MALTDKYLFQKKESVKAILNRLSQNIITILDIDQVAEIILSTLRESLRLESGAIILKDEDEKGYSILNAFNVKNPKLRCGLDDFSIRYMAQYGKIVNLEDEKVRNSQPLDLLSRLDELNAVICIPLFIHRELIGLLTFGKKKSDEEYTQEELDYFPTVESQVAIALSNARVLNILRKSQADFAQQSKMAAIGTLSAGIGHEIKNPLNNVMGLIGMLKLNQKHHLYADKTKEQFETEVFEALARVEENVKRANGVIERLSSFAKKPKEEKIEKVCLEKAIENALGFLGREFEHYNISIQKQYDPAVPEVLADSHAIEDVLLNLLINARHAIKEKGTITVSTVRLNGDVEVTIGDTGHGIAHDHLDKIFDPFFTTKDTTRNSDPKSIKGSGLGLFVVRETVKKFGGRISVESEVDKGTVFRLQFPVPH